MPQVMQKDIGAWVEQLRFEANYLSPEESRMMNFVLTMSLILVVAVSALNLSFIRGEPIVVVLTVVGIAVGVGALFVVVRLFVTKIGYVGRKSREYAEKYRKLVSWVFLEDLEAESISKQYAEIKRKESEWLEKRFGL